MPTRNELLANHVTKATGIAAVYADDAGAIGAVDVVGSPTVTPEGVRNFGEK